jgi:uncharacterized protein
MDETKSRAMKYIELTRKAREKLTVASPTGTHLYNATIDALDMVDRYVSDADHFIGIEDYSRALAASSYAHGWLDCMARLGLIDVEHDSDLFTVE